MRAVSRQSPVDSLEAALLSGYLLVSLLGITVGGVGDSNGCADVGVGVRVWPLEGGRYLVVEDRG